MRRLDEETGLYHYRARAYDPANGRFLQRDPLEYVDGPNARGYVTASPTNMRDPNGDKMIPCSGPGTGIDVLGPEGGPSLSQEIKRAADEGTAYRKRALTCYEEAGKFWNWNPPVAQKMKDWIACGDEYERLAQARWKQYHELMELERRRERERRAQAAREAADAARAARESKPNSHAGGPEDTPTGMDCP